jgi:type IV pilus assembly protein PilA
MFKRIKSEKGFTLIELMIVVAIIGILAAVAIPNFLRYQAKSMQSEARVLLSGIYTSQTAYFAENNSYADWDADFSAYVTGTPVAGYVTINQIGFEPASAPRYFQVLSTVFAANTFTTSTSANLDSDASIDGWSVSEASRQPQNTCNDVTNLDLAGVAC